MDDTPRRACRFVLDLEADTRDDLATAMFNIASQIERGELSQGVSGGYSSGYIYELSENDRPTHTEWAAQLRAYLDAKKAPPDGAPTAATPASTTGSAVVPASRVDSDSEKAIEKWLQSVDAQAGEEQAHKSNDGVDAQDKVQLPEKARAGIEVLRDVVEKLLTTSRYVDEEGEATLALADMAACIADPPFRLAGTSGPALGEGGKQG